MKYNTLYSILLFFIPFLVSAQDGITLSGQILRPNDMPVQGLRVEISDSLGNASQIDYTDAEGRYRFEDLAATVYNITMNANEFPSRKRVTTFDLLLIRMHILGVLPLNRYEQIAADVNGSEGITTLDMVLIHRFMFFMANEFTTEFPIWLYGPRRENIEDFQAGVFNTVHLENVEVGGEATLDLIGIEVGNVRDF